MKSFSVSGWMLVMVLCAGVNAARADGSGPARPAARATAVDGPRRRRGVVVRPLPIGPGDVFDLQPLRPPGTPARQDHRRAGRQPHLSPGHQPPCRRPDHRRVARPDRTYFRRQLQDAARAHRARGTAQQKILHRGQGGRERRLRDGPPDHARRSPRQRARPGNGAGRKPQRRSRRPVPLVPGPARAAAEGRFRGAFPQRRPEPERPHRTRRLYLRRAGARGGHQRFRAGGAPRACRRTARISGWRRPSRRAAATPRPAYREKVLIVRGAVTHPQSIVVNTNDVLKGKVAGCRTAAQRHPLRQRAALEVRGRTCGHGHRGLHPGAP